MECIFEQKTGKRIIIYRAAENHYKADIIQMAIRVGKLREPKITSAFRDKTSPPPTASQNKSGTKQQLNDVFLVPTLKVLAIFITVGDLVPSQVCDRSSPILQLLGLSVPNCSKPFSTDLELV